jgi:RNA polymerase sigma-70 factor (ECF subfamily)
MERDVELALVKRLQAGDTSAFDEIYEAFSPSLLGFLCRMTGNRAVAEDLLEETWLRLVTTRESLQADTRLAPWLFTVARNLYVSYCRSRAREQAYTSDWLSLWPDEPSRSPFETTVLHQFEGHLETAVAELPPLYREVLLLVGVEGLRPSDAAKVCGISPQALRQRLSRARALLTQRLHEKGLTLHPTTTRRRPA